MLYLENPDLPDLDIGRNSYMMPKIRRSFEHAHQLLTNALGECLPYFISCSWGLWNECSSLFVGMYRR